jgi:hypothetical protein
VALVKIPNLICLVRGHRWKNEQGGSFIDTSDGASICYRCGYREIRGYDPASWFDYPNNDTDSWGTINPDKIPDDASL